MSSIVEFTSGGFQIDSNKMYVGMVYGFKWEGQIITVKKDDTGCLEWFCEPTVILEEEEEGN